VPNIAIWKTRGLQWESSWKMSITGNGCIRRSAIDRQWSSSIVCRAHRRWRKDEHEFSKARGIYRSDDLFTTGSKQLCHSQRSSASMSSSRLFLGRLLSSRACLRFAGCERFSKTEPRRTMIFQRTASNPLTSCLSPRVQSNQCRRLTNATKGAEFGTYRGRNDLPVEARRLIAGSYESHCKAVYKPAWLPESGRAYRGSAW
jgi:hypothetical protein